MHTLCQLYLKKPGVKKRKKKDKTTKERIQLFILIALKNNSFPTL